MANSPARLAQVARCHEAADNAAAFNWEAWSRDFDERMAAFNASLVRSQRYLAKLERER